MTGRLKRIGFITAAAWTILLAVSLIYSVSNVKLKNIESAKSEARGALDRELAFRRWGASVGGLYVMEGNGVTPNALLSHIPGRDVITASGTVLTLVNPAYMVRMVHELGYEKYGLRGHLTSLNPLRPENKPDAWEKEALKSFHEGQTEYYSIVTIEGKPHLRLMRSMTTGRTCLKCHAVQGYKIGDVRGGISVSVPLRPHKKGLVFEHWKLFAGHFIIWCLGLIVGAFRTWVPLRHLREKEGLEAELRKGKDNLEAIVSSRTKKLKQKTAQLEKEILEHKKMQATLRKSEERFRALFEGASEGILVADIETAGFIYANPAICKMLGYTEEELKCIGIVDIHPEGSLQRAKAEFRTMAKGEKSVSYDLPCLRKNGEIIYVKINTALIEIEGSKRNVGFFTDITEQKEARDYLRESETLLRDFMESANDMIQSVAPDGSITYANAAWRETLGYVEKETAGLNMRDVVHPDEISRCMDLFGKVISGGEENYIDTTFVTKQGERIEVEGTINCSKKDGSPTAVMGIFRNVTERNVMIDELRESESNLNSIMENSPIMTSLKDVNGNYLFVNSVFEKIYGVSRDDIVSGNDYDLFPPEIANVIRKSDREVRESGRQMEFEETLMVGSSLKSYVTIKFPILDGNDNPVAVCSMGTDISDRKEIEEALKALSGGTASRTGDEFFKALTKSIARVFNVRYAFIAVNDPAVGDRIRTITFYADGTFIENVEYALEGTPCNEVYKTCKIAVYPERVSELFVDDKDLAELSVESYLGVPILDSSGNTRGIFSIMDDSPMTGIESRIPILEVFATRIGAEMERVNIEKELRTHKEELEETVERRTAELSSLNERLSSFSQEVIHAQEKERTSLARELHDQIGQLITSLSLGLEWVRMQPGIDQARVATLADVTEKISLETRRICKGLRPIVLDRLGLLKAIEELAREFFETSNVDVSISFMDVDEKHVDPDVEINVYRIVQEAFTNIIKYADAKKASLVFSIDNERWLICIKDDGIGAGEVKTRKKGFGIMGMKERANLCGGTLEVRSERDKGTELILKIPFENGQ